MTASTCWIINFFLNLRAGGEQALVKIHLHDETANTLECLPWAKRTEFKENVRKVLPWVTVRNTPLGKKKEVTALIKKFDSELYKVLQITE